jgi:hypothetical protein
MKTRAVFRSLDQHTGEHRPSRFFASLAGADKHLDEMVELRAELGRTQAQLEVAVALGDRLQARITGLVAENARLRNECDGTRWERAGW